MIIDLPLSLALGGLELPADPGDSPAHRLRAGLETARAARCGLVQLDATAPGLRPRELDRSARRDLASTLRRHEVSLSGLDLFIPPEHFASMAHQDRASAAVSDAIALAGELAGLLAGEGRLVSLELPENIPADVRSGLAGVADHFGVTIGDHRWSKDLSLPAPGAIMLGIDPAKLLMGGADVLLDTARLAPRTVSARLSDLSAAGRVVPGTGRLDLLAYRVALISGGYPAPVVLDLRQVKDAPGAAVRASAAWAR